MASAHAEVLRTTRLDWGGTDNLHTLESAFVKLQAYEGVSEGGQIVIVHDFVGCS